MKKRSRHFIIAAAALAFLALLAGCGQDRDAASDISGKQPAAAPHEPEKLSSEKRMEEAGEQNTDERQGEVREREDCFSGAAFIGNSRSLGLQLYSGIDADFYCSVGMNVKNALSCSGFPAAQGQETTLEELLCDRQYRRLFISLGINELGWEYPREFSRQYGILIDRIRALQPEAEIYVQALIPVTAKRSGEDKVFNNERISLFNQLIDEVVKEKQVKLLMPGEALVGEDGALPEDASVDGIHLTGAYCGKWAEYLRQNVTEEEAPGTSEEQDSADEAGEPESPQEKK